MPTRRTENRSVHILGCYSMMQRFGVLAVFSPLFQFIRLSRAPVFEALLQTTLRQAFSNFGSRKRGWSPCWEWRPRKGPCGDRRLQFRWRRSWNVAFHAGTQYPWWQHSIQRPSPQQPSWRSSSSQNFIHTEWQEVHAHQSDTSWWECNGFTRQVGNHFQAIRQQFHRNVPRRWHSQKMETARKRRKQIIQKQKQKGHVNCHQLCEHHYVKPFTQWTGCGVALLLNGEKPLAADIMISHTWDSRQDDPWRL